MAGDWIKMRADLFTHPKVFRIAEILGKDELYTVGALFCFWAWADKHCVDGLVDGASSRLIDRATRVDGLSDALVAVGWLEIDNAGAHIPRFEEHNGDTAKERSLKNQRQARWRAGKTLGHVDAATSTSASTKASTREEKRRDISTTDVVDKSDLPQNGPKPQPTKASVPQPEGVDDELWRDFMAMRRAKKAPVTATAIKGIQFEAVKAGLTLPQALAMCCSRGWQGFKAEWVRETRTGANGPPAESFRERDERLARERMAAFLPGIAAKGPTMASRPAEVIDITPPLQEIGHDHA